MLVIQMAKKVTNSLEGVDGLSVQVNRVAAPVREQVFDQLRQAIVEMRLKPEQRLVERELIEQTLRHRATPQEIVEVLELTSTLGIHACNCGVPILLEELEAAGSAVDVDAPLTPRQEEIKARF